MRLTEDQVRQGLQHSDKEVRFAALEYFAKSYSRNASIMPVAIEVIEARGPRDAFVHCFPIRDLAQTEATIVWAVERLKHSLVGDDPDFDAHLLQLLCHADPQLALPHKTAILESLGIEAELAARFTRRLEFALGAPDVLWQRLESICEAGKDRLYPNEIPYAEAEDIAEALARDDSQAERMLGLLKHSCDQDEMSAMAWLEIFLVQMAGGMRYEPAVPELVGKLRMDGEVLNEQCVESLTKIGTDSVVQAVRDAYPQAPNHFRLYGSGLFGNVHSDLAVSAGIELLSMELDHGLRNWLATELVDQFSTEAIDAARQVLLDDPDCYDLKLGLTTACKLLDYDVPELEQWQQDVVEASKRRQLAGFATSQALFDEVDDDLAAPTVSSSVKTGRNDPCPCGSGKKFKKCCLNKPKASG